MARLTKTSSSSQVEAAGGLVDTMQHGREDHVQDHADTESKSGTKKKYPPRSRKRGLQRKNKAKEAEQSDKGNQKTNMQVDGKEISQADRNKEETT